MNILTRRLNKSLKHSLGFTMPEVLIATAILGASAIGGVSIYKEQVKAETESQTVKMSSDLVASYKRFHTVNRRSPSSITELINSEHYVGAKKTPWGSALTGGANATGDAFTFTIPTQDSPQALRLAGSLGVFNATASGSFVTFKTATPTSVTIADQMLCRTAIAGSPGCNTMEVDLDVNNNDLVDIKNVTAQKVDFDEFYADSGVVDTLTLQKSLVLGNSSIGFTSNRININANMTSFSGNIEVNGDIVGNNTDITGLSNVTAETISSQIITSTQGVISNISGSTLDYTIGDFGSLNAVTTKVESGTFGDVTTRILNAVNTTTDTFTGGSGTFNDLAADRSSGIELDLSGTLTTNTLNSKVSNLGEVNGTSGDFTGTLKAAGFNGGPASFNAVTVSGAVSGGNFYGNSFCTNAACVGTNRNAINSNSNAISNNTNGITRNASAIANNLKSINQHTTKISNNSQSNSRNALLINDNLNSINGNILLISDNTSKNASNKSASEANTRRINTNGVSITGINNSLGSIESDIAILEGRWSTCVSAGGCQ